MRLMVFVLKAHPPDWRTDDDEAKDRVDMQSPRQFNYSTFRQIARPPVRLPRPTNVAEGRPK